MDRRSFLIAGGLAATARSLRIAPAPAHATAADVVRLSSLAPRLANHGWGKLLFDIGVDGKPITIAGRQFAHGVSTHARSDLVYLVGGRYARLRSWVGVQPGENRFTEGTAVFQVWADGRKLFESGVMRPDSPAERVDVALDGCHVLRLAVSFVGTYLDHVAWAEAELEPAARPQVARRDPPTGPTRRLAAGDVTFTVAGSRLTGLQLAGGRRIALAGGGGLTIPPPGVAVTGGSSSFSATRGGLRWSWELESSSRQHWTAAVDTWFRWPNATRARVWMPWGHGWEWEDPLVPRPFESRVREYGAFFNREHGVSLPMATILDEDAGVGVTFIQSPDDVLLDMQVATTADGELRFSRAFNRFGGGAPRVAYHVDVVVHEPDVRAALRAIVDRYPAYFEPVVALAQEIGGGSAYSGWEGELDTAKMRAMGFTMNWKASLDFPYMGMFLPPLPPDAEWNRFAGGGSGTHNGREEGKYGRTSIRHMNDYSADMRRRGFWVLNYFNVTEFGTNIVYDPPSDRVGFSVRLDATVQPSPPLPAGSPDWLDSRVVLRERFADAILRTPHAIPTWGNGVIMDCGDPAYRDFLLDQARRHVAELPDSSGICIDRMDWLTRYNPNADDGVTWIDGPQRHLRRSWIDLMDRMGPIFHDAGKVIFANDMDRRLELMRQVDGFYDEHGHFPFNLNASAFLALRKPLACWTPDEPFKPDVDTYFQRLLYLGAWPTVPYPGNDHTILPEERNEREYRAYGPLFDAIRGRRWVLEPAVITSDDGAAKVNLFETNAGLVAFVGLGGAAASARVTTRRGGPAARVLHPGAAAPAELQPTERGVATRWTVPLVRGCALLLMA